MKQALQKAQALWGKTAIVEDKKRQTLCNGHVLSDRFVIGRVQMGMFFMVEADGPSWEAAFVKYEARQLKERERYARLRKGVK